LQRKSPKRLVFSNIDRLVFAGVYGLTPSVRNAFKILKPATVIAWHRAGFRAYWRWKSPARGGRPRASREVRELIREISIANPLWGAPRIHCELLKLGINLARTTVAIYRLLFPRTPRSGCERFVITCIPAPDPTKPNRKIIVSRHYEIPRDVAQSERFRVFEKINELSAFTTHRIK
jgi:hypothetical protein